MHSETTAAKVLCQELEKGIRWTRTRGLERAMHETLAGNHWLLILLIWTIPWKGLALWRAARRDDKWWFIALLIFQTLALLEILYIFVFSRRRKAGVRDTSD